MKRISLLILCLTVSVTNAANWYVRPAYASGSHTGVDWNNAWSDFSINWNVILPGDTIWMSGGTYSQTLTYNKSGTIGKPITIKLATSLDPTPTSAAGWIPALSTTATIVAGNYIALNFQSYVTIDGNVNAGQYGGIIVIIPSPGNDSTCAVTGMSAGFNRTGPNNTDQRVQYVTVSGPNANGTILPNQANTGSVAFHFCMNGQTYGTNLYIGHCLSDGCNIGVFSQGTVNGTVEYCRFNNVIGCAGCANTSHVHNDIWIPYDAQGFIWRYNIAYNLAEEGFDTGYIGQGEGPFFGVQVYGNVFDAGVLNTGAVGNFVTAQPAFTNCYNNTFVNSHWWRQTNPGGAGPNLDLPCTNNLFWNGDNQQIGHSDYNFYTASSFLGVPDTHSIINTVNPFVNVTPGTYNTNQDYHLKSGSVPINAGVVLVSDGFINRDMDGNIRGANGSWDIGAYEFGGSPSTNPVTQPSVTSITFPGVSLTNTTVTQSFSIQNTGQGTLTGYVYNATAPFKFSGPTNYTLTSNQSQSFTIQFNPTVSNTFNGSVKFIDNGGGTNINVNVTAFANILLTSPFPALGGTLNGWLTSGSAIYQPTDISGSPIGSSGMATAYYWFSVPATTNYTITAQGLFGTEAANSFWVNIDNPPADPAYVWDVEPAIPVTTNALISLRGTGGNTNNQFQPNTWFLLAGPHQLILYGREANAQVSQFTINGPNTGIAPVITGPQSVTNDVFNDFQMSVTAVAGTIPLYYQWYSNNTVLLNQTNSFYSSTAPNANTNTYACIVTNLYGVASNAAFGVLTNGTLPTFVLAPVNNYTNSTNGGVNLSSASIGTLPLFFHWKTNGVFIPGALSSNYSQTLFTSAFTNTYTLQVDNHYGTLNSSGTLVQITNGVKTVIVTNQPVGVTNLRVLGFSLSVGVDGTPPITFQWQKNGINIPFTSSNMSIVPCLASDSGTYRCVVSNPFGSAFSSDALVSMTNGIIPMAVGPFDWTAGTNTGIQMSCAVTNGTSVPGLYPITFQWSVLGTNISGQTSSNIILTGVAAQTNIYSVIIANFEGATTNSATATITNNTVIPVPITIISQPQGITNEAGTCYLLNVYATGTTPITYQWRINGVNVAGQTSAGAYLCPTTTANSGSWDCVLTNAAGSVTSSVVSLVFTNPIFPPVAISSSSVDGKPFAYNQTSINFSSAGSYSPSGLPLTYVWTFGDGAISPAPNPRHTFTRPGLYNVRMSVSDGINPPTYAKDLTILVQPFSTATFGSMYLKKLTL